MSWLLGRTQILALLALLDGPKTVEQVSGWAANNPDRTDGDTPTGDRVHAAMRRLENRYFVRRTAFKPTKWELTSLGEDVAHNV